MDIVVWLRSLGLGKYEAAFRENEIDDTVLLSCSSSRSASGGTQGIFRDYRLRVASVVRDYDMNERREQAPADSRAIHEASD
jgi:SAM domain (Sterile alpha motif)